MTRKKPGADRKRTPWLFGEGKYLSTVNISRNAVSSGASVDTLRGALGLHTGIFDEQVRQLVIDAQVKAGLPLTGVVTEEDWDAIVNPVSTRRRNRQSNDDEDATPDVE